MNPIEMRPQTLQLTRWAVRLFQEVQLCRLATIYSDEAPVMLGLLIPRDLAVLSPRRAARSSEIASGPQIGRAHV